MTQEFTLKITSKGQTTVPVDLRRLFGLKESGDTLRISFNTDMKVATVVKPKSFEEIQEMMRGYMEARGTKVEPLEDVRSYYQTRVPKI